MVWDTKETLCTVAIVAVAQLLSCVQLFVIPGTAAQLFSSVAQSCPTLYDPMNCSTPGPCPSPTPRVHSNSPPSSR